MTNGRRIRAVDTLQRYGLALVLVGVSLWLSFTLHGTITGPFWVLFPIAVVVSNWYGGRGAGWFATALAAVSVQYYLFPPVSSFTLRAEDIPLFCCFVGIQILANWVVTWRRQAEEAIRLTSEDLVAKMLEQQRTDQALQQTRCRLAFVLVEGLRNARSAQIHALTTPLHVKFPIGEALSCTTHANSPVNRGLWHRKGLHQA